MFLELLRCPVTRSKLKATPISMASSNTTNDSISTLENGILYADKDWFYPVINGVPRLIVEAFLDYEAFFILHMHDFKIRKAKLLEEYKELIAFVVSKNRNTKRSFSKEWENFDYEKNKTWGRNKQEIFNTFLTEVKENGENLAGKLILDAGCGNGLIDHFLAESNARVVGMDLSLSIEKANNYKKNSNICFIQGDVQFPPLAFGVFDIVYCSGVLHHTFNTELSFSCIEPCVKQKGKFSIWLYHPRKNLRHYIIDNIRKISSRLPIGFQYRLYKIILVPPIYIFKKIRGRKQDKADMLIELMDSLSPKYRREHNFHEAASWFYKRDYSQVEKTTSEIFGFNIIGVKNPSV